MKKSNEKKSEKNYFCIETKKVFMGQALLKKCRKAFVNIRTISNYLIIQKYKRILEVKWNILKNMVF